MPTSPPDDERRLLLRVAEGDETAFRQLFYGYADLLGTFVLKFTHSKHQSEEIVQDVFLKIWMSREILAGVENFTAYLYVVSRNQTLNAMRQRMREMERHRKWKTEESLRQPALEKPEADEEYLHGLIDRAIGQLPPQQKHAWLLSRRDGFTHRQIAKAMNLSQETIKKYIMSANRTLVQYMQSRTAVPKNQANNF